MKAQRYLGNGSVSIFSSVKRDLDKRKVYLPSSKIVSFLGWPGCQVSMVSLLPILDSFFHPNSVFFFYIYCQVSNQGKYLRTPVTLHLFCLGLLPQKCRFFHDKQNFTKLKVVEDDDYLLNYIYYTYLFQLVISYSIYAHPKVPTLKYVKGQIRQKRRRCMLAMKAVCIPSHNVCILRKIQFQRIRKEALA